MNDRQQRRSSSKVLKADIDAAHAEFMRKVAQVDAIGERAERVAEDIRRRTPRPSFADTVLEELNVTIPKR